MAASKKIEEGQELMRQAEKSLKTSILKWRPDYEIASDEYQKAATCFRIAKSYDQSKDCFLKAIECHKQSKSWFHAAKCYEQIILILKETNNLLEVEPTANKACSLYQQHGSPESGASALDKAAKVVEHAHPDVALRLYQHALEVVMIEESTRQAAEFASKISRILVKLGLFDQATDALRREIGLNQQTDSYQAIGRLAVVLVLVQLARGDYVAAEKAFKEWGNCCDPQEVQTLEMLLQAYDDEDPDQARQALSSPFIRHMDVEYAKLARDLPLPKGIATAPKANVIENATASYKSPNAGSVSPGDAPSSGGVEEDEEEEGALC
ncbi:gamma-soluble NSF attachment protein-like [Condylostylus longicornis]|uniref:gamma-soluble NSF attachment protein-like n=1 Tax=Condylostylus longicornis TaxID=2530218 RepID=UPI00244E4EC2|nr:gamma-soluble NSF attachment protein-like [Condylostylus longicornis]